MKETFETQLRQIVESFDVRGASEFDLLGTLYKAEAHASPESDCCINEAARKILSGVIYELVHIRRDEITFHGNGLTLDGSTARDFVTTLSQANSGRGAWEPGWRIDGRDRDGRLIVSRRGLRLWVRDDQFRAQDNQRPGSVGVNIGKEFRALLSGFYMAIGDA
ncbi:MAG: hypothetical protein HY678_09360, partial [Chloroflexi bacterium]|nr:hypothetical protein [Chloroflexota bacterium]